MPARKRIGFAASAVADLEEILAYYSSQQVPDVGVRLAGEILGLIEDLTQHPDRGRVVPEFDRENLREIIHPPFRIVYRRDRNRIRVVRVWRSERLLKLSKKERGEKGGALFSSAERGTIRARSGK